MIDTITLPLGVTDTCRLGPEVYLRELFQKIFGTSSIFINIGRVSKESFSVQIFETTYFLCIDDWIVLKSDHRNNLQMSVDYFNSNTSLIGLKFKLD